MENKFVTVLCDVDCVWDHDSPRYRVFVNDELFTERTWIWRDHYIEEMLQILAPPGQYQVKFSLVDPELAQLSTTNLRIGQGDARITPQGELEILP